MIELTRKEVLQVQKARIEAELIVVQNRYTEDLDRKTKDLNRVKAELAKFPADPVVEETPEPTETPSE